MLPTLRDGAASTALQYAPKHHAGRAEHRERGDPDDSLRRDRARLLLHDARVAGAEQDADQKERRKHAVDDGGPEQRLDGIDLEEVDEDGVMVV